MSIIDNNTTFWGYRRENGRVGVRNHVIILPVDDISNAACEAVANNIKGTMALPHPYGRLQFGADLELHFRTLIGTGANPNVAAVVVICTWMIEASHGSRRVRTMGRMMMKAAPNRLPMIEPRPPMMIMNRSLSDTSSENAAGSHAPR